ncbi:MAG: hypothetical protein U0670_03535 [Anaerolineae bacterium]
MMVGLGAAASGQSQQAGDCPAIVQRALAQMQSLCQAAGRNQVCYANYAINAIPQPNIRMEPFNVGDSRDMTVFQSLQLSPLDEAAQQWGVALLHVQANLPDTLPGQNATILVFGDSELTPLPNAAGAMGQAFQVRTRIGQVSCSQTPTDGLIVQTPEGTRRVALTINGVDIQMGSTVFIRANARTGMNLTTLRGAAYLHTRYGDTLVPEGAETNLPLDEDYEVSGAAELPVPYDLDGVDGLPLDALDEPIDPADPMSDAEQAALYEALDSGSLDDLYTLMDTYETGDAWFDAGEVIGEPPDSIELSNQEIGGSDTGGSDTGSDGDTGNTANDAPPDDPPPSDSGGGDDSGG